MNLPTTNRFDKIANTTRRDAGMTMLQKPTVLILGSSGQIGRFILEYLKRESDAVHVRVTRKRREAVRSFNGTTSPVFFSAILAATPG
jgi:NAD(P)-dependent dehydrogenase (short-subunit alcohol dehydrogenase family)